MGGKFSPICSAGGAYSAGIRLRAATGYDPALPQHRPRILHYDPYLGAGRCPIGLLAPFMRSRRRS